MPRPLQLNEQLHDAIVFAIPFCLLVVTIEIFALDKLHGADTDRFGHLRSAWLETKLGQ